MTVRAEIRTWAARSNDDIIKPVRRAPCSRGTCSRGTCTSGPLWWWCSSALLLLLLLLLLVVAACGSCRDVTEDETKRFPARRAWVMRRWRGSRERARRPPRLLLAPLNPHLQLGVERLPHAAGQQGHVAQQPDDFPLAGQGQLFPDAGRVGSGGAQLGQQVDLSGVGEFGADLGQPGIDPLAFLPHPGLGQQVQIAR